MSKWLDDLLLETRIIDYVGEDGRKSPLYGETSHTCLACGEGWGTTYPPVMDDTIQAILKHIDKAIGELVERKVNWREDGTTGEELGFRKGINAQIGISNKRIAELRKELL